MCTITPDHLLETLLEPNSVPVKCPGVPFLGLSRREKLYSVLKRLFPEIHRILFYNTLLKS